MCLFHDASQYIHAWLLKQMHVKEESLTDWLLYYLSERDDRIIYQAFSRNEESLRGADWEWWIITEDEGYSHSPRGYRFLVQAKKLKKGQDNFPLLNYCNKNGLQMDMLLDSARSRNAMPLYLFYSTDHAQYSEQIKNFPHSAVVLDWCKSCINGCYLSPAMALKALAYGGPRTNISERQLVNNSLGLSICDYPLEYDAVNQFLRRVNDAYKTVVGTESNQDYKYGFDGICHFDKGIPTYVRSLINGRGDRMDWLESEFRRQLDGVSGVSIVDLRKAKHSNMW